MSITRPGTRASIDTDSLPFIVAADGGQVYDDVERVLRVALLSVARENRRLGSYSQATPSPSLSSLLE